MKFPVAASNTVSRTTASHLVLIPGSVNPPGLFFSRIALAIVGPSNICVNFRISLSISTNK